MAAVSITVTVAETYAASVCPCPAVYATMPTAMRRQNRRPPRLANRNNGGMAGCGIRYAMRRNA